MPHNYDPHPPTNSQRQGVSAGAPDKKQRSVTIAKPLWRPLGWPYRPSHPKIGEHFLHPLHLLTVNAPLTGALGVLATAQLQTMAREELVPVVPIPSVLGMLASQMGVKHQCHSSDHGVATPRPEEEEAADAEVIPEKCLQLKQKEGRPTIKPLKEPHCEAFSRESDAVKVARRAYYKSDWLNFKQEESYDISSTFQQLAVSTNLLGTEIYEVQENWCGRRELQTANHLAKFLPKET